MKPEVKKQIEDFFKNAKTENGISPTEVVVDTKASSLALVDGKIVVKKPVGNHKQAGVYYVTWRPDGNVSAATFAPVVAGVEAEAVVVKAAPNEANPFKKLVVLEQAVD